MPQSRPEGLARPFRTGTGSRTTLRRAVSAAVGTAARALREVRLLARRLGLLTGGPSPSRASLRPGADERFLALLEALPQEVWIVGPGENGLSYANGRCRAFFGAGAGRELSDLEACLRPEDRSAFSAGVQAVLRDGAPIDLRIRARRRDGEERWLRICGVRLPDGSCLCAATDIEDTVRAEHALRHTEGRFRGVFESRLMGFSVFDINTGETLAVNDTLLEMTGITREQFDRGDWHWQDATPPEYRAADERATEQARVRGWWDPFEKEYVRMDGSRLPVLLSSAPLPDEPGRIVVSTQDITRRRNAERHQRLLMNELNHRVKNTLAIVQSIAAQTFRGDALDPALRATFEARLIALARAHDVLTRERWEGADLKAIVEEAVEPHRAVDRNRFAIEGPAVRLAPATALSIAMGLQELGTNAAKYGALSREGGRVDVAWSVAPLDGGDRLRLTWRETGGPPVEPPARKGFGSRLLERGLARELAGSVALSFGRTGVACTIDVPLVPAVPPAVAAARMLG